MTEKVIWLYGWIPALAAFVKESKKAYDGEEVTKNTRFRLDVKPEWVLSLFVQLHGSIDGLKMDSKNITDTTKLVKELVRCFLVWGTNGCPRQDHK